MAFTIDRTGALVDEDQAGHARCRQIATAGTPATPVIHGPALGDAASPAAATLIIRNGSIGTARVLVRRR